MIRKLFSKPVASISVAVVALIVSSACGRGRAPEPFAGNPESDAAKSTAQINSITWDSDNSLTVQLPCDDAGCDAPTVNIKITPNPDLHRIPIDAALRASGPNSGYFVAQITNLDQSHRAGGFNLGPGESGYLWAGPTVSHGRRFALYSNVWKLLSVAVKGSMCHRAAGSHAEVHVPPPNCPPSNQHEVLYDSPVAAQSAASLPSLYVLASNTRALNTASMVHLSTLWFSCSGGCCEAGGFTEVQ